MTPAELLQSRQLGIRPVAMVSGTCGYRYDMAFTWGRRPPDGLAQTALGTDEAGGAGRPGANAVGRRCVGAAYPLRCLPGEDEHGFHGGRQRDQAGEGSPPVQTRWSRPSRRRNSSACSRRASCRPGSPSVRITAGSTIRSIATDLSGSMVWENQPLTASATYWRRDPQAGRKAPAGGDAERLGDGACWRILFRTAAEGGSRTSLPPDYLGRFIVIGTAVACKRLAEVNSRIVMVIDMCDGASPLNDETRPARAYTPIQWITIRKGRSK